MEIQAVHPNDAGVVMCIATNQLGSASTSGTLKVNPASGIVSTTLHPAGQSGLNNIQKMEVGGSAINLDLPVDSGLNQKKKTNFF